MFTRPRQEPPVRTSKSLPTALTPSTERTVSIELFNRREDYLFELTEDVVHARDITVPGDSEPVVEVAVDVDAADGDWLVLRISDPGQPADDRADAQYATFGRGIVYGPPVVPRPRRGVTALALMLPGRSAPVRDAAERTERPLMARSDGSRLDRRIAGRIVRRVA